MSVATELVCEGQRLEYFVAIEGIGWPVNGLAGALSGGFAGTVWSSNDMAGTLATVLGCTVNDGLELPDQIAEEIEPRTTVYSPGGLSFSIQDHGDWWLGNLTPRKTATATTLYDDGSGVGLHYADTNVKLTDGTTHLEDDLVWVGGREMVKLGPKIAIAGDVFRFYPSIRGYLGTQRGSSQRRAEDYGLAHWPVGTSVSTVARWWINRRVSLWAHVPGETVANCELVWIGRLRDVSNPSAGLTWNFSCVGDFIPAASRIRRAEDWRVTCVPFENVAGYSNPTMSAEAAAWGARRVCTFHRPATPQFGADKGLSYDLAAAYAYRTMPGGTQGMVTAWDTAMTAAGGDPQAESIGTDSFVLRSYVMIEDAVYYMYKRHSEDGNDRANVISADIMPYAGGLGQTRYAKMPHGNVGVDYESYSDGAPARFLLTNIGDDKVSNRFTVNGVPTRNVVDTLLIFMLSSDREYYRADTGAGSTATNILLASTGTENDEWIGCALFCMEGTYKWEARPIIGNDDTTLVEVSPGFSGAPAAGVEMQVRNSIYDVLPFGWGMGVPARDVDIESFERVRDEYLKDSNVGEFILGTEDEIDLWEMLVKNICQPYGILVYFDYETRKVTARYVGQVAQDGAFETYTAISRSHIIDTGDVRHTLTNPISSIKLKVRAVGERVMSFHRADIPGNYQAQGVYEDEPIRVGSLMGGKTRDIIIRSDEANAAFAENELDKLTIEAMFNDEDHCAEVAGRYCGIAGEYSVPPPVWDPALDMVLYQSLKLGSMVVIDWNTPDAPANPYSGVRGWTSVVGRVLRRSRNLKSMSVEVAIELLLENTIGRLAPAAKVTSKGNDANGDYFVVEDSNFVADSDEDKDWWYFAVGDKLTHRDATGATVAGWAVRAISGFGTNFVSDPTLASTSRVYVDGAIGSAVAAGDYITFDAWSAGNTARMELYSAYATAGGALTGGDSARTYG